MHGLLKSLQISFVQVVVDFKNPSFEARTILVLQVFWDLQLVMKVMVLQIQFKNHCLLKSMFFLELRNLKHFMSLEHWQLGLKVNFSISSNRDLHLRFKRNHLSSFGYHNMMVFQVFKDLQPTMKEVFKQIGILAHMESSLILWLELINS